MGLALLARHFEESAIPDEIPALLRDGWKGGATLSVGLSFSEFAYGQHRRGDRSLTLESLRTPAAFAAVVMESAVKYPPIWGETHKSASRIKRTRILNQVRTRRRLWPAAVRMALAASPSRPLR